MEWAAIMAAVPGFPWGTGNAEGLQGGFWCLTCDINYKGCLWKWVSDDGRSWCSHSCCAVKAPCNFHVSLQVSRNISFSEKAIFIFNIPSLKNKETNALCTITNIWDKGCSALLGLRSFQFQGCGKRQRSKCFPFLRAHKSFPCIHSFNSTN